MSKHADETGEMFIGKVVYKCANGSTEIHAWFYFGKIKTKSSLNWKHQNQIKYSLSLTESKAKQNIINLRIFLFRFRVPEMKQKINLLTLLENIFQYLRKLPRNKKKQIETKMGKKLIYIH